MLNGEIFYSLKQAQVIIESWRRYYNTVRTHGFVGAQLLTYASVLLTRRMAFFGQ